MAHQSQLLIYLNQELERRKNINPRYSLRAFAKLLNISSSLLSRTLKGSVPITEKMFNRFSSALKINKLEYDLFLADLKNQEMLRKNISVNSDEIIQINTAELKYKIDQLVASSFTTFNFSSTTLDLDSSLIPELEERVLRFLKSQASFIYKNSKIKDSKYDLSVLLFPTK